MSGYMIAEIWCDIPNCDSLRLVSEDEGTLRDLRTYARSLGWKRRRAVDVDLAEPVSMKIPGDLIDVCPDCAVGR